MSVNIEIDQKLAELSNYNSMNDDKLKLLNKELDKFIKFKRSLETLNLELKEYLYESKRENDVLDSLSFQEKMEEIDDTSLTIYVHNAQVFKIYGPDNLNDFEQDDSTHYRKPEYGPVHEVVRDKHPQKLIFVFNSILPLPEISKIKNLIVEFMKRNKELGGVPLSGIHTFTNNNSTEFHVSNVLMMNMYHKESVIELFMKWLCINNQKELSKQIQLRSPICEDLDNARLYALPSSKVSLDTKMPKILDCLVSIKSQSSIIDSDRPIHVHNYINVTNINSNNQNCKTISSNIASGNAISNKSDKKTLQSFYKHIYDTRPEWYKEDGLVPIKVIENAYREYFDDYNIKAHMISRYLNGNIFKPASSTQRSHNKKLVTYDTLKLLFTKK